MDNDLLPLLHLPEIDSTQSFIERHPELGFCGVLAASQIAGRGRGGNSWESAPGTGLCLSAAIPIPEIHLGVLLQRAMEAVIEVLKPCGLELGLKWPNDLVAWHRDGLVKLGGIIGEVKEERMILGLGINLSQAPFIPNKAIPPASLADLGVSDVPEPDLLARSILDAWHDLSIQRVPAFRWPEAGDEIAWEDGSGRCAGWMEDGRLAIETANGLVTLTSGDVYGVGKIFGCGNSSQ